MPKRKPEPKPKSKWPGTTPIQMRLTDRDKEDVEAIRVYYGLGSRSAAIRLAIQKTRHAVPSIRRDPEENSEKKPM